MSIPGIIDGVLVAVEENKWGGFELQIEREALDGKGRKISLFTDVRVAPYQVESGMHNAYRAYIGKIVFVPVQFSIYQKDKGSKPSEQVQLSGLPMQIQRAVPAPAAAQPALKQA